MSDVTEILCAIAQGNPQAAEQLLPLVYDELRKLASQKMAQEKPGQTLEATALVHEAYLRLVGNQHFENQGHFFAAAAEAMRRILVERARRRVTAKHGGQLARQALDPDQIARPDRSQDLLALNDALDRLEEVDPAVAKLVQLRYFAGMTNAQAALALDVAPRTADGYWAYAKAWLLKELEK